MCVYIYIYITGILRHVILYYVTLPHGAKRRTAFGFLSEALVRAFLLSRIIKLMIIVSHTSH